MANKSTAVQVIEPDSGELVEINLDNWHAPTDVELGRLRKLGELRDVPIAIVGISWTAGKRQGIEDKECALIAYLDGEKVGGRPSLKGAYSFSESVIKGLRNFEAAGKGTPNTPVPCKVGRAGPTSNGFYVDKLETLAPDEDKALQASLAAA